MAQNLYCSECPNRLTGNQRFTCCDSCRGKRSRRLKVKKVEGGENHAGGPDYKAVRQALEQTTGDAGHEVLKEELRPIARDLITEDTVRALASMVELTGRAVECIGEDLYSQDAVIRQRAYTLLMKYTVGHQALIRPEEEVTGQMVVNFNLPRPGDDYESQGAAVELVSEELRTCDMCAKDKAVTQFVAGSDRCQSCYDEQREFAQRLLDGTDS